MSWGYYGWRPYVPMAERRARAARELAKLTRKNGQAAFPVSIEGRNIASTFWGKAWCDNLEAYSDFANRLPRGRTYVRNGSVVDLQIGAGRVTARVSGSELYKIEIKIKPLPPKAWKAIQRECSGQIDSLLELLQGKFSSAVMQVVTRQNGGLFPTPREIDLDCSCPDWADLCKHVAASLYGVGARLDSKPELLFVLRGVDPADLITKASAAEAVRQTAGRNNGARAMSDAEVADVFGIELDSRPVTSARSAREESPIAVPLAGAAAASTPADPASQASPARAPARASRGQSQARRRLSPAARARIAALAKARWQRLKKKSLTRAFTAPLRGRAPSKTSRLRAKGGANAASQSL